MLVLSSVCRRLMCLITLPGLQSPDHKPKPPEDSGRNATQLQDPAAPALRGQVGWTQLYYRNIHSCIWQMLLSKVTYTAFKFMHSLRIKPMTLLLLAPCSTFYSILFYSILFYSALCYSHMLCSVQLFCSNLLSS